MNKKTRKFGSKVEPVSCEEVFTAIGEANPKVIQELLDLWSEALNKWFETHELEFIDGFMAAHNFHKLILMNIAETMGEDSLAYPHLFAVAEQTWSMAMREAIANIHRKKDSN